MLGLFTLVLAISLAVSYYEVRHSAIQLAGERLSSLSKVLTTFIEQQNNTRVTAMHRVARDTAIRHALETPDQSISASAQHALDGLAPNRVDSLVPELWTRDARRVGQIHLELPADEQRVQEAVRRLAASGDSTYVGPLRSENGRAVYWLAVTVREPATRDVLGFIVFERQIFAGTQRGVQPWRDLIGADIDFSFRNANETSLIQLTGTSSPAPVRAERYLESVFLFDHGQDGQKLGAATQVRGTPFSVVVERSMDAILARPLAMMHVLVLLSMVLAVLGALLVWFLGRQLVRPLGELTSAVEAIAHGHYNERVEVRGSDEVSRLSTAFNRMAHKVEEASEASDHAVARLTKLADNQAFLADASGILAGSLSDETMLAGLAHYCVPRISDYCTIHIADDDGVIRRIETAHSSIERQRLVRSLVQRYEYRSDESNEVAQVIRTQKPVLLEYLEPERVRGVAPDATAAQLLDAVKPCSYMCVPLIARGRAFGAISFTMTTVDSNRHFTSEDVDTALELAQRVAAAIDNAVIYRRSLELRMEAEAASSAKSDFLAKMSHEIRTPINAMMGYAELLQMGISGPVSDVQAKQLERIRASGDHLTSLVNEILDLAKIEAGRMGVQSTVGTAGDAAEAALSMIRPQAASKGIELSARVDGLLDVEYFGDPQRVQQILTNLLSNAVKFTPAGGRVSVHCDVARRPAFAKEDDNDWSCISVADTGPGIQPGDIERIFHPFVQADAGYTRVHGGTGLGLTISRSLAQMMGGEITVESTPGAGSRFSLWLPCPIRAIATS